MSTHFMNCACATCNLRRSNQADSVAPTQGTDAQFIAEHGHRLAELLKLDYYDIADRDAQITMLLANKQPQPSQGADARPVAIYQMSANIRSDEWKDCSKDAHDHMAKYPACFKTRIVYATRDAAPSDTRTAGHFRLTGKELLEVIELIAPDAFGTSNLTGFVDSSHEDMEREVCIGRLAGTICGDGVDTGAGIYAWDAEYPEEGVNAIRLDPVAAIAPREKT
jgi:hypothetical protein